MYCQFPGRQCCDNEYLLKLRAKLRRRILQSLQDELEENGDRLEQLVVGVLECELLQLGTIIYFF